MPWSKAVPRPLKVVNSSTSAPVIISLLVHDLYIHTIFTIMVSSMSGGGGGGGGGGQGLKTTTILHNSVMSNHSLVV